MALNYLARDLYGYGPKTPDPQWPGGARIAVSFVLNYEEGGENTVLNGDPGSEVYLTEVPGGQPFVGQRDLSTESVYEYGSRAGFWRILRLFAQRKINFTSWAVGRALELNLAAGRAMIEAGHEVASHGYRWINYKDFGEAEERDHMHMAIRAIEAACGKRPVGWYTGRFSDHTLRLVVENGGFLYSSDSYADDLPYYVRVEGAPHLIVPYTLDVNDMKFAVPPGFSAGEGWFNYMKDAFDTLYAEGVAGAPKMMSIGLHCRLAGRPGRAAALARFMDHVLSHERVWVATREQIARHWLTVHPPG
ncbi:MAG: allantoinase PuuE [Alphaproteobacteria bacterium]|nr:allantoinase PuuE [Alphaproteobacteria bacterium]